MKPAALTLEDGSRFLGITHSSISQSVSGEVVFTTGMTGYESSLTDPSFSGQILCFTFPLIGNYGVLPQETWESQKVHPQAVIVNWLSNSYYHSQAQQSLRQWLDREGVALLTGVDTRRLTKTLRSHGVMLGTLSCELEGNGHFCDSNAIHQVQKVSPNKPVVLGDRGGKKVVVVDCGMKANILRFLQKYPFELKVVPYNYDFTNDSYDAVFLSNGPGDPVLCRETVGILQKAYKQEKPVFGICLGAQLMALAAGAATYKLPYGHRGHNQPCLEVATKKAYITSQNHGYAIEQTTLPSDWEVSFVNLNDGSVEGIQHKSKPFFAVQFHPEAAPGPTDTTWLFEKFAALVEQ